MKKKELIDSKDKNLIKCDKLLADILDTDTKVSFFPHMFLLN
jgi:chromatin remodeling complex protein RSC6